MIYEDLVPITREQYRHVLRVGTPADASEALLRIVHHDPDHDWAEGECCAALQDARNAPDIGGYVEDALDDWMIFGSTNRD